MSLTNKKNSESNSIPVIEISHLIKKFHSKSIETTAVNNISIEVSLSQVYGFLGPNGAGKSTTIKMLLGFLKPDSGTLKILNKKIGQEEFRHKIGYLPELPFFYDHLTARETLVLSGKLSGMSSTVLDVAIPDFLKRMDLCEAAEQRVGGFSKGMKQRLGMANALIHDPDILIFDEPMSGLDPIGRHQIKKIIKELQKAGKTIFFSSHILSDIEELCDCIGLIHRGRLLYSGDIGGFLDGDTKLEQRFVQCIQEADDASFT